MHIMYYVYILKSLKDGGFYIGCSENPKKRLVEHNKGKTLSLKSRRPLELVYFEKYDKVEDAYRREKQIKSYKSGNAFKDLIKKGGVA
jgi:putative endonuclease